MKITITVDDKNIRDLAQRIAEELSAPDEKPAQTDATADQIYLVLAHGIQPALAALFKS